jgi:hypothetical protein
MALLGGRLGRLLELWEQLGEYADEILELIPLLKDLRLAQGVQAKAAVVVKIAKLFTDDTPTDIDDRAVELVEEFLKHPELTQKVEALLRALGVGSESVGATPNPPDLEFQTQ